MKQKKGEKDVDNFIAARTEKGVVPVCGTAEHHLYMTLCLLSKKIVKLPRLLPAPKFRSHPSHSPRWGWSLHAQTDLSSRGHR